ncbi:MAG TPA: hypothetical protein VM030_04635 [Acidimicrobiales bacterium]|nr:hypothetical protein [Acidimicrobiales bacterium]
MTWNRLLLVLVLGLTAACGSEPGVVRGADVTASTTPTSSEPRDPQLQSPPDVVVRSGANTVTLKPWSYCYRNGCVDGSAPVPPADVGRPREIAVSFPLPDWSFTATFRPAGAVCPREQSVPLVRHADGGHRLAPAGKAGTYDVTLFGRGDGDLSVTFRWTTPVDGPLAAPEARLAVLADHDGRNDSYGVELMLANLAADPKAAAATVTVRADANGSVTFAATRSAQEFIAEGTVYWDGPDEQGKAAARLPGRRFTYVVDVELDGVRHHAEAHWPDDVIAGNEPSVGLTFAPPLPALG